MTPEQKKRVETLAYKGKRGEKTTASEDRFMEKMWRTYPEEYASVSKRGRVRAMNEVNPMRRFD